MAFVHHHPRQQRRERQGPPSDSPSTSFITPRQQEREQDWSIVFPGRPRDPTPSDHTDENPLALTLPPLHDGTGRFLASPLSPTSAEYTPDDAAVEEGFPPESIFSGTDSQLDADEELGFGSGSDFDFSDAPASHTSRSSVRRGRKTPSSRRRPSRLRDVTNESDEEGEGRDLLGSKAWSLLNPHNHPLESVVEGESPLSSQLYASRERRRREDQAVVWTSGEEEEATYDADLAVSNLAQSAGLSSLRRPKRRHKRAGVGGRSSKRSNTSQSLLSIDYESRLLTGQHGLRRVDGVETPRSKQKHSKTSRVIGSILRKVFDLEPEVLDAFLQEEQRSAGGHAARVGFGFESAESPLVSAPTGGMMLDGRDEHERYSPSSETETESLDPAQSPLFSNTKPTLNEDLDPTPHTSRLTEAALLSRRPPSPSSSLMEPTTMEALSAFVNTIVHPVPMPFRLLGALFGWSSIFAPNTKVPKEEEEEREREEEERKYRYERLLSAQQAREWSRKYRGILCNVDDEREESRDVPECWRGEEHPAIAGNSD